MKVYVKDRWGGSIGDNTAYISDYVRGPSIRLVIAKMHPAETLEEYPVLRSNGRFNACRERLNDHDQGDYFVIKAYKAKKAIEKCIVLMQEYVKGTPHEGLVVPQLLEVMNRPERSRSQYIAIHKDFEIRRSDHLLYIGVFTCMLSRTTPAICRSNSVRDLFDEDITGIPENMIASEIQGRFFSKIKQETIDRILIGWRELLHDKAFKKDMVGLHPEKYPWHVARDKARARDIARKGERGDGNRK